MLSTGDIPSDKCLCRPSKTGREKQPHTAGPQCNTGTTQLCTYSFSVPWSLDCRKPKPTESSSVMEQRGVLMVLSLGSGAQRCLHSICDLIPRDCHTNGDYHPSPLQGSQLASLVKDVLQQHQHLPTSTAVLNNR